MTFECTPEQLTSATCAATETCAAFGSLLRCFATEAEATACHSDACCKEHGGWIDKCLIRSSYSHWVIIGLSIFSIIWGVYQAMHVSNLLLS